jgi:branched-chain amino acid transport system substrate-binding protein
MQTAKSIKPAAVRDALAVTDIETLYGRVKFTPEGDGDAELMGGVVGQVQKGDIALVFPDSAKTAPLIYYPAPPWNQKA